MITPAQCRMARAALQWTARDLARLAGVSAATIAAFESESGQGDSEHVRRKLRAAFEDAGVGFIGETMEEGPGVRLSKVFARGFIYDGQGRHVASIQGEGVYDVARGRRIATVRDRAIYGLDGAFVGALQNVDVFNSAGSLPDAAFQRLFAGTDVPRIEDRGTGHEDAGEAPASSRTDAIIYLRFEG